MSFPSGTKTLITQIKVGAQVASCSACRRSKIGSWLADLRSGEPHLERGQCSVTEVISRVSGN